MGFKIKKAHGIQRQLAHTIGFTMIRVILFTTILLVVYNTYVYVATLYENVGEQTRGVADMMESYGCLGALFSYWEEHMNDMPKIYDEKSLREEDQKLRRLYPDMPDYHAFSDEEFEKLSEEEKMLFATVCYGRLSQQLDGMKRNFKSVFLFSFSIKNDKVNFMVTGCKEGESRISQGGEIFELGVTNDYAPGMFKVLDRIISGEPEPASYYERVMQSTDQERVHMVEPLCNRKGEMIGFIAIAEEWKTVMQTGLIISILAGVIITFGYLHMVILLSRKIRKKVIEPLTEHRKIITQYEKDKDSEKAIEDLNQIHSDNEVEELVHSYTSMLREVERYIDDIRKVTEEKDRITAELSVAANIQADQLPSVFPPYPERKDFELYASMDPAKEVGGDFYDFFMPDQDHIVLVIADVSGKGIPAALFMLMAKTIIKNRAMMGGTPAEILSYANERLCEGNDAQMFVTVWLAVIDLRTGKGVSVNAGHEHPILKRANGQYELIRYPHSVCLGAMEGMIFKEREFELDPGDRIFVYTDGAPEANDVNEELFGTERLVDTLNAATDKTVKEVIESVNSAIEAFAEGAEQFDDTTMLEFRYYGVKFE